MPLIYVLSLNDMRSTKSDTVGPCCWSHSREVLEQLIASERVAVWYDEHDGTPIPLERIPVGDQVAVFARTDVQAGYKWQKTFRRGSRLEWCNPPATEDGWGGISEHEAIVHEGYLYLFSRALDGVPELTLQQPEG